MKEMDIKELKEKAAAHIVKMLDGTDGERWNGSHPMYEGVCGWCGVMAPLNRPAFVEKFGEEFTKEAEAAAIAEINWRNSFWQNSAAFKHMAEAGDKSMLAPSSFKVGDFVFGRMMNLKCEGGLKDTFRNCLKHTDSFSEASLCKIEAIFECDGDVAEDEIRYKVKEMEFGGAESDDYTDEIKAKYGETFREMPKQIRDTFFTKVVLVRDRFERWYLIDFEGFDYARYVLLPVTWDSMFRPEAEKIQAEIDAANAAAQKKSDEEKAARAAAYKARCEKWESIMQPVPEGHDQYSDEYRKIGKRNVAAMAKAAFPWVRFSVSYSSGWGRGYTIKWKNGPTAKEVQEACDFGLFCPGRDTFNGYDDSTDREAAEFAEFANKFGGVWNGVNLERVECEKDQNGDPNGKPPAPPKPSKVKGSGSVEVKENKAKGGLEIYFPSMPSENIREFMKSRNWRWSKFSRCWWHKATDEARNTAAEVVAMWEKETERAAA